MHPKWSVTREDPESDFFGVGVGGVGGSGANRGLGESTGGNPGRGNDGRFSDGDSGRECGCQGRRIGLTRATCYNCDKLRHLERDY